MRFDRRNISTSRPGRKSRTQVYYLIAAFVFVLLGIEFASKPANWSWIFPAGPTDSAGDIDREQAVYDMAAEVAGDESASRPDVSAVQTIRPVHDQPVTSENFFAGVDLSTVQDDTLGLESEEMAAYRTLLSRLREIPAGQLQELVERTPNFGAVMLESDHYRGAVFRLKGLARRVLELPRKEGEPPLYELWVFTHDSGLNPWRVVATSIPEDLPRGVHGDGIPVKTIGIFFKRQGYETQHHKVHVAPLVLAKSVAYKAPASAKEASKDAVPWVLIIIVVGGGGFAILLWWQRREDDHFEKTIIRRINETNAARDQPAEDPETFLKNLAGEQESDPSGADDK